MAIIKETTTVFFAGMAIELIKGNEVQDNSPLVKAKPELFENTTKSKTKKSKTTKVQKSEEPKEELLIEEPVAALDIQETLEIKEETVEEPKEETPKRRRRK
jgi:hypothetical protein